MSYGQECLVLQYRDNRPSTSVLNSLGTVSKNSCKTWRCRSDQRAWPGVRRLWLDELERDLRAGRIGGIQRGRSPVQGDYGFAYGGGVRLRPAAPLWLNRLAGQYLRFTSDDDDSVGDLVEGEWEEIDLAGIMTVLRPV